MKTQRERLISRQAGEARLERVVSITAMAFLCAHLVASFFSTGRTWGFHHWMFYSIPIRILFFTSCLICLPKVSTFLIKRSKKALSGISIKHASLNRYVVGAVLSVICFPLFWFLRAKTHFLGDGYLRLRDVEAGIQMVFAEPFDSYLHFAFHRMMNGLYGWTGEISCAAMSCFIGSCFIFCLVLLSHALGKSRSWTVIIFVPLLLMGSVQLFFGYVENYTLLTFEVLLFILVSVYYLRDRCSIFIPSLVFSIILCTHISAVILSPSLLFLYVCKLRNWPAWKEKVRLTVMMILGITIPVVVLVILFKQLGFDLGLVIEGFMKDSHIIPLKGSNSAHEEFRYGLLSFAHFINLVNEIILIAPVALLLSVSKLFYVSRRQKPQNQLISFLGIMSISCVIYLVLLKPNLGASRDWDLFAVCSVPWTLYTVYVFKQYKIREERLIRIVLILCITAFFHTIPWITVNADTERSIERFTVLTEKDASWSNRALANAYDELGVYFYHRGYQDQELRYRRKAAQAMPDSRYISNLGGRYIEAGMYDLAISELSKVDDSSAYASDAHFNMGIAYIQMNMVGKAVSEFQKVLKVEPDNAKAWYNMGRSYYNLNRQEEAIAALNRALQINPNLKEAHQYLGAAYLRSDQLEKALTELQKALANDPDNEGIPNNIGIVYSELNRMDEAIREFQKAVQLNPEYAEAYYNMGLTYIKMNEPAEAMSAFEKTLRLHPEHSGAKQLLESMKRIGQGE